MRAPTFEVGVTSSLVILGFPAASADFGMRSVELGECGRIRPLRGIQAEQASGNALGLGGYDRRRRQQGKEGYRSGKYDGLLEKLGHEDFSFRLTDAPRNARVEKYNGTGNQTIKVTGHITFKSNKPLTLLRRTLSI